MRLTGFVTINGARALIDWTINGSEIVEDPGLSAAEIVVEGAYIPVIVEQEEVVYTDGYEDNSVTELKVLLQQAGEPIYGNKQQLIDRLRAWDADNSTVTSSEAELESVTAEQEASATDETPLVEEGDETNGVEGERFSNRLKLG